MILVVCFNQPGVSFQIVTYEHWCYCSYRWLQPTDEDDGIKSKSLGIATKPLSATLVIDADEHSSVTTANEHLLQPPYDEIRDDDHSYVVTSSDDNELHSSGGADVDSKLCPKELAYANDHTLRGVDHPAACQRDQMRSHHDQNLIDANRRLGNLWLVLRSQVSRTWSQFNNSAPNNEFGDRTKMHCWLTPVRWVRQTGPKWVFLYIDLNNNYMVLYAKWIFTS